MYVYISQYLSYLVMLLDISVYDMDIGPSQDPPIISLTQSEGRSHSLGDSEGLLVRMMTALMIYVYPHTIYTLSWGGFRPYLLTTVYI